MPRSDIALVAFIRTKKIDGVDYFYLVEGTRVAGKVKQRVVAYLGKHSTVGSAYLHWLRESKKPGKKTQSLKMMKALEPFIEE